MQHDSTPARPADVVVVAGAPDDVEIAALVAALAALAARPPVGSATVTTLPATAPPTIWPGRDRYTAPAGWVAQEARHLRRVA